MSAELQQYVTIGCVNYQSVWGEVAGNLEKMKRIAAQAGEQKVGLLVFPELALSGYECDERCMHATAAQVIPGPATEEMAATAAKHGLYIVFGMPERDSRDPDKRYISSVIVGPEGFVGRYRKIHLARPPEFTESLCFTAGSDLPVFNTSYGLVGLQICFDFWVFPELTRILVLKGAEIVINTTASPSGPGKPFFLTATTAARAAENRILTASANLVGKERKRSFYGQSCVAASSPPTWLRVYAQGGSEEEIVTATVNLAALRSWRARSSWQHARRDEIILNELSRLAEERIQRSPDRNIRG
ncbi:MAG: carbon-nitrogen hydrolase family protein [Deltaproteobacteria bacterium]|nr:carbon-nitrogen hydrolase family protein [Deltaproteobacteria bacterium]